jgi:hypothetical protein
MSLAVALVGAAGLAQIPAPPTCSALPGEEAGELLRRVVRDELVPRLSRSGPWKTPEQARAVGVRIGDNEFVVYGTAAVRAQVFIYLGNLAAIYPAVESAQTSEIDGEKIMIANVQGLLYTSLDLEVLDAPTFEEKMRRGWAKTHTIPRGGYTLAVGELGVFLQPEISDPEVPPVRLTIFVTFRHPIGGIDFKKFGLLSPFPSVSCQDPEGFVLEVAKNRIGMRPTLKVP